MKAAIIKSSPAILLLTAMCMATSCSNMSEEKIEKMMSAGVVLVQNQSYYEVVLSNGSALYFSSYDESDGLKGLTFDEDSIQVATSYGTGFFISDVGEIATCNHVVSNIVKDKNVNKSVADIISALKKFLAEKYSELNDEYRKAQQAYEYANYSPYVSYDEFYRIRDYRNEIKEAMNECEGYYYGLNEIRASDSEIKYHNEVSIAYNNTFVTNTNDFISCVITKTDPEHDLAIIQIKDKKTPAGTYVFAIDEEDPLEHYSWGDNLSKNFSEDKNSKMFMTGFNLGPALALTEEGIMSQFNSGTISQKTSDRLMYSIPALPGSSGSPVVNYRGQLVAINYASLKGTQSFNYGIRVKHLKALINK